MNIHLFTEHDLDSPGRYLDSGAIRHGAFPYGADRLSQLGNSLSWSRISGPSRLTERAWTALEHRTRAYPRRGLTRLRAIQRSDVMLALLEPNASFPAWARRHHIPPFHSTPLALWSCWAAEELLTGTEQRRRQLLALLQECDVVYFLSRNQQDIFAGYGVPEEKLQCIDFGINPDLFPRQQEQRTIDVVSVGLDRGRDYDTLIEAARGVSWDVVIKTSEGFRPSTSHLPPNVQLGGPVSFDEYRCLLQKAKIVVVPSKKMAYPSGQSVALQAASTGAPVVTARTSALQHYFTDGIDSRLYEPGDHLDLRRCINGLYDNAELRTSIGERAAQLVRESFTEELMWTQVHEDLSQRVTPEVG
ncbi:glycosyltransferase family 4 protein [Kocuria sp. M1R5S2]|uniref:glycosyltransferase family 4 protein n=1 Tax=Kocuria rhizosphaerae TaxID=3376285 RepID=UPI0037A264B9